MNITLRDITADNWEDVAELAVSEDQLDFVAPNWYSMLQVLFSEGEAYHQAIYHDDTLVGYAMMGQLHDDQTVYISRLMIDRAHQGKGYGRRALRLIIAHLQARYQPPVIQISFEPVNLAARHLYQSEGFHDTGAVDEDGELIFELSLV